MKVRNFDPIIDKPRGNPVNGGVAFTWETRNKRWRYILYNNKVCRIDDYKKFTTKYYVGDRELKRWFRKFDKQWLVDFEIMKIDKRKQHEKAKKLFFEICDKLTLPADVKQLF